MKLYANTVFDSLTKEIMHDKDNQHFTELGWKPIVQASTDAKILIIGQAPGLETQMTGEVFHDRSGDRLRDWLGIDENEFYQSGDIAVLPMDFYYPGKGKGGDLPPRSDFAKRWHPAYIKAMPNIELTILIGQYSQKYYLKNATNRITDNVLNYKSYLPNYFPLIHPSPRNQIWISKHIIFEEEILPELKKLVASILSK